MKLFAMIAIVFSLNAQAEGPCHADVDQFCKDVKGGRGRIMECLRENKESVSEACKSHIAEKKEDFKKGMKEIADACEADREKFCADVKGGKGRIMKCLKENKENLSTSCQEEFKEKKKNRK